MPRGTTTMLAVGMLAEGDAGSEEFDGGDGDDG
jgi:hypothetical protein